MAVGIAAGKGMPSQATPFHVMATIWMVRIRSAAVFCVTDEPKEKTE